MKKILVFAREAGGAATVAPVCDALLKKNGYNLLFLASDKACTVFDKFGFEYKNYIKHDDDLLEDFLKDKWNSLPDMLLTSASSIPNLSMTDKLLWRWAGRNGVKSVGILDQWQNYALRFSGIDDNEKLSYMPDSIFVMDETAKCEMIADGIPESRIMITGQPAFDRIKTEQKGLNGKKIKKDLRIDEDSIVIVFVAELLTNYFGDRLGYTEQTILKFIGDTLNEFCNKKVQLLIKLHPENKNEDFEWALNKWPMIGTQIIDKAFSPQESIAAADMVIGMTSVMLIESIIAGKPTVSLQLNSTVDSQLAATNAGAIPFIKDPEQGENIICKLIYDDKFRKEYLETQYAWSVTDNAVEKCVSEIDSVLRKASREF
jgi:hypothetical protein